MNLLEFIAALVGALAWPAVVVLCLFLIRKEFPAVVASLRKLKYKELELEFAASAKAVEIQVEHILPEPPIAIGQDQTAQNEQLSRLETIAQIAPRSAILEAWLFVESAAVDLITRLNISQPKSLPGPMRLRDLLIRNELLSSDQVEIFEELRRLRNEAVHVAEAEFTPEAVSNYLSASLKMASYLRQRPGGI